MTWDKGEDIGNSLDLDFVPPVPLTPNAAAKPIPGTSTWGHIVDDGKGDTAVVTTVAGNKSGGDRRGLYIAELNPLQIPENADEIQWVTIAEEDDSDHGANSIIDMWHVFQWGYHWVSYQGEIEVPLEGDGIPANRTQKLPTLRIAQVEHNPSEDPPFKVVASYWIVRPESADSTSQHSDSMVAGTDTETRLAETNPNPGEKGPDGKIDYDKFVFAETNDHFLARWGDSPDFGLVAGVRPVGGAGVGIELVHFRLQGSDELTYAGRSFVGGQNYGDEAALNLSSSGTPSVRLQALGAGTRLTIEMNVFGPTDLGTGTPSELRVITAKTPAIDGQSNSTRRVVSPLLEKAGWNYAMPTGVILPGLPSLSKYWLVTYRGFKTKSEDPDDYGDVYRTWFTEEFRRTGTLVRELVSDNTGLCNRPHNRLERLRLDHLGAA